MVDSKIKKAIVSAAKKNITASGVRIENGVFGFQIFGVCGLYYTLFLYGQVCKWLKQAVCKTVTYMVNIVCSNHTLPTNKIID